MEHPPVGRPIDGLVDLLGVLHHPFERERPTSLFVHQEGLLLDHHGVSKCKDMDSAKNETNFANLGVVFVIVKVR